MSQPEKSEARSDGSEYNVAITIQQEPWEEQSPSYISLRRKDMLILSEVMQDILTRIGVRAADRVLIYDFNTSLSTLVMSRVFAPSLIEGVSERMKFVTICTDGLSELASRSAYVLSHWQPHVVLVRSDLIAPLRSKLNASLKESNPSLRNVIVLHNDVAPWPRNIQLGVGDFNKFLLYKVDPSLFMCIIKPCGGIYYSRKFYKVSHYKRTATSETTGDKLLIGSKFLDANRHSISSIECEGLGEMCACGETHEFRTKKLTI